MEYLKVVYALSVTDHIMVSIKLDVVWSNSLSYHNISDEYTGITRQIHNMCIAQCLKDTVPFCIRLTDCS